MLCLDSSLPDVSGALRQPVSMSAEICSQDDVCVHVMWVQVCVHVGSESCILWGVIGGTYCKQIFVGISKSLWLEHVLFTFLPFSL